VFKEDVKWKKVAEEVHQQKSDTATIVARSKLFPCRTDLPTLLKINVPKKLSIFGSRN
jgi:hypothetical protein